jgi:hypothetical protein
MPTSIFYCLFGAIIAPLARRICGIFGFNVFAAPSPANDGTDTPNATQAEVVQPTDTVTGALPVTPPDAPAVPPDDGQAEDDSTKRDRRSLERDALAELIDSVASHCDSLCNSGLRLFPFCTPCSPTTLSLSGSKMHGNL